MFKTILTKTAERMMYGFGFGVGMGFSFKLIPINKMERNKINQN
jgi:hypothetical protein